MTPIQHGAVNLTVAGRPVSIAPTFRTLESIEGRLGIGIPALLGRAISGDVRVRDLAVIVHEGLKGAGIYGPNGKDEAFTLDEIGEDVLQRFSEYAPKVGEFLGNALQWSRPGMIHGH